MSTESEGEKDRPGVTDTLTISLPKELKAALKAAARADDRSVSNFLVRESSERLTFPLRTGFVG